MHPDVKNWIRYAKFEEGHGFIKSARSIYERAIEFYGEEHMSEKLFIAFAKFEENQKEHERARVIYKYALDLMPREKCVDLYKVKQASFLLGKPRYVLEYYNMIMG